MKTWTEACGKERAKIVEARGVRFCCLPCTWTYHAALGKHSCRVSQGMRRGKETKTGFEVDSVWFVNLTETQPNGDAKNIHHAEIPITGATGSEEDVKAFAFELGAKLLLDVQRPKL